MKVADKRYYTNADRSKIVKEGSEDAAFLVVAEGGEVTSEMEEKYGIKGVEREEQAPEPGIVISSSGPDEGQGFVPAAEARKAGMVVTDAGEGEGDAAQAESSEGTAATKAPAKRPAAKSGARKSAKK